MVRTSPDLSRTCPHRTGRVLGPMLIWILACSLVGAGTRTEKQGDAMAESLWSRWRASTVDVAVRMPSSGELQRVQRLFLQTLRGDRGQELQRQWRALGCRFAPLGDGTIWILEETRREGRGFYAFRPIEALPVVIQAPHVFHDLGSGPIVARLFTENRWLAAAWNTAPRRAKLDDGSKLDLSNRDDTYFQAFTLAASQVMTRGRVVQIHGFDAAKRRTAQGRKSAVILSSGQRKPGTTLTTIGGCMTALELGEVRLFGVDVFELGATRNKQGRLLQGVAGVAFVHLELNRATRERLERESSLRGRMAKCLADLRVCRHPRRGGR
ncbi:hypothetical protein SCOR_05515 [Sulfidibacter corallicola]